MKVIVALEGTNLSQALYAADALEPFCDAFSIGAGLLLRHGASALKPFATHFSRKELIADAKIMTEGDAIVAMLAQEGAHWITVLAGTEHTQLHKIAAQAAHEHVKLLLDLSDATSPGQTAMEAVALNVTAVLWHAHANLNNPDDIDSQWDFVHENCQIPVFVHSHVDYTRLSEVLALELDGLIVDTATLHQPDNPAYAERVYQACKQARRII